MLIDVYDFDGTLYDGDSTVDFVLFCLRRHPSLLLELPGLTGAALRLARGKIGLTAFKSALFGLMARRVSLEDEAGRFWQDARTRAKLYEWFRHTPRDLPIVIASASPEFELTHAAALLGVEVLIGTRCDASTGRLLGANCKGEEKLRRIGERMGEFEIRAMYTDDARADGPLLARAREGYLISRGVVTPYRKE